MDLEAIRNRILNACWQYGLKCCRGEVEPAPGHTRAIRIALRCIMRGKISLAAWVVQRNETAKEIWRDALA